MSHVLAPGDMPALDATWHATLLELSNVALMGVDLQGKVVFWSRGAEALFGWSTDEVVGQWPPCVTQALKQEWQLQLRQVIENLQPTPAAETQRITRDGRAISIVHSSAPARDPSGKLTGVLDIAIDSTGLRQQDEELRLLAQVRERELVAMDLHDGLIQSLYGVVLNLAAQEQASGDSRATDALKQARAEVERAIADARAHLDSLRGPALAPADLGAGLALLADGLRANSDIDVHLSVDASIEPLLAPRVRGHLLYLAREAASNVIRHASASTLTIALSRAAGSGVLKVEDNGVGFVAGGGSTDGHRGLRSMAERARLVGGTLIIDTHPGRGTLVRLEVPL